MVQSFIPAVNLEDNRGTRISTAVLTNLFNAVQYVIDKRMNFVYSILIDWLNRKKHSEQLKNQMIEIISVILAEYESIPNSLLELLFARIIDPEKV